MLKQPLNCVFSLETRRVNKCEHPYYTTSIYALSRDHVIPCPPPPSPPSIPSPTCMWTDFSVPEFLQLEITHPSRATDRDPFRPCRCLCAILDFLRQQFLRSLDPRCRKCGRRLPISNMSLGFQRLNVKKTPPNERIAFIKALPGNDEEVARDFLERIAAQCGMPAPCVSSPVSPAC